MQSWNIYRVFGQILFFRTKLIFQCRVMSDVTFPPGLCQHAFRVDPDKCSWGRRHSYIYICVCVRFFVYVVQNMDSLAWDLEGYIRKVLDLTPTKGQASKNHNRIPFFFIFYPGMTAFRVCFCKSQFKDFTKCWPPQNRVFGGGRSLKYARPK